MIRFILIKPHLLLYLLISVHYGHSQLTVEDIPRSFNLFELYPDSTIKAIYESKNDVLKGWSIEFDENGRPTGIGKYKNNVKKGKWRYIDGKTITFNGGKYIVYEPPYCGISDISLLKKFYKLVEKHFHSTK